MLQPRIWGKGEPFVATRQSAARYYKITCYVYQRITRETGRDTKRPKLFEFECGKIGKKNPLSAIKNYFSRKSNFRRPPGLDLIWFYSTTNTFFSILILNTFIVFCIVKIYMIVYLSRTFDYITITWYIKTIIKWVIKCIFWLSRVGPNLTGLIVDRIDK